MSNEVPTFLSYENRMETLRTENPHLWLIRDLVYRVLAKTVKYPDPLRLRYFSALFQLINSTIKNRRFSLKIPKSSSHQASHFIFLNSEPNHFGRIYPLFTDKSKTEHVVAWVEDPRVLAMIAPEHRDSVIELSSFNLWCSRPGDLLRAWRDAKRMQAIFPEFSQSRFRPAIFCALFKYYSMLRFWLIIFARTPNAVYTTFEKGVAAKSMMEAAQLAGCSERVHCLHGLFHPSLVPTFATEMWCISAREAIAADVCLPSICKAKFKVSDESKRLRGVVGVIDQNDRNKVVEPHILVLGTSTDPTYEIDMRLEDLRLVRSLIESTRQSIRWRFRPHPGSVETYRKELELAGIPVADFSQRKLEEDLRWTHVVIAPFSSVGLEAQNLGRIVFWNQQQNRNLFDIDQLVSDGVGSRIDVACFHEVMFDHFPHFRPG